MASTNVIYNNVELHNVQTKVFEQEIVYDPSNTDVWFSRYKMLFSGIVHIQDGGSESLGGNSGDFTNGPAWISVRDANGTPQGRTTIPDLVATIRARLSESRKDLQVYLGGNLVINCLSSISKAPYINPGYETLNANAADLDNGPKPKMVSITHVGGSRVYRVSFGIECAMVTTNRDIDGNTAPSITASQAGNGKQVQLTLNNRWSVGETLDDSFFVTRTIRGKMRIPSPMYYAHSAYYKNMVVPALEKGFRRDKIEYAIAENMLEIDYAVTDKQVHIAAPWPAVKMDATYTESTDDGVACFAEVFVRLEGTPASPVPLLIQRALQVVDSKLQFSTKGLLNNYKLTNCSITEFIGEKNAVEVRMRVQHVEALENMSNFVNLFKTNFSGNLTLPAGEGGVYDQNVSASPAKFGYDPHGNITVGRNAAAFLVLLECYAQNPWGENTLHDIGTSLDGSNPPPFVPAENAPQIVQVPQGTLPAANNNNLSEKTIEAMYTYARAESRYISVPCRVQLPIAAPASESADSCQVFTLGGKQGRREIRVDTERVGAWPEIPEPADTYTDGNLRGTLLKYWDRALPPTLAADKTQKIYRIEAYYLYALNRAPIKTDATKIGVLPNTKFVQSQNTLTRNGAVYSDRMKLT